MPGLIQFGVTLVLMLIAGLMSYRVGRTLGAEEAIKLITDKEKNLGPLNLIEGFELPEPDDPRWVSGATKGVLYALGPTQISWDADKQCAAIKISSNNAGQETHINVGYNGSPKLTLYYFAVRKAVGQRVIQASLDKKQLTEI